MTHRIMVCGIYKSGTSLVTGLLNKWGAYIGRDDDLFQGDHGCLEHLALMQLNDELLNNNDRVPTPVKILKEKANDQNLRNRAQTSLTNMDNEARENKATAWAWKDPRLPMVLPFWEPIWDKNVIYVIPVRHPIETIFSAAKMEGLTPEQVPLSAGLAYWQFSMLNILMFTQNNPRKIFVAYDKLIENPQQECERLGYFLDEQCGMELETTKQRVAAMSNLVTSDRYHQRHTDSLADLPVCTAEQRALYNFLRVKTLYPDEPFNPDDFALYPGWLEYLQTMDALVSFMQNAQEA
jgi:hypothetical protein